MSCTRRLTRPGWASGSSHSRQVICGWVALTQSW